MKTKSEKKPSVPLWRNKKVLPVIFQVIFVALVAIGIYIILHNISVGLRRWNMQFGFQWLQQRAGFNINEAQIPYTSSDTYQRAFIVGFLSTLRISFLGIVLSTIIGVIVGIAKMSKNWLLSKVASTYIDIFRNTPLLLQIFIFNFALFLPLPHISEAVNVGSLFYLSNRGASIPWLEAHSQSGIWMILLLIFLTLSIFFNRYLLKKEIQDGKEYHPFLASIGVFALLIAVTFVVLGQGPAILTLPEHTGSAVRGGLSLSTPFLSVLLALTVFTSTYIAEIVRGGIAAVPKGQSEATQALGFKPATAMRLVIFPQAVRIIIPPMTSQYLNLIKNSSLAMAVGFQEVVGVGNTVMNQSGRAIETVLIMISAYLIFSITTSIFMNIFNKKFQLVER
jgi:general L-amino acid transport system permease protein